MKTFSQFCNEAYDAAVMSGSQIRRQGEGGRVGTVRKKSTPEIRRTKRTGGGETRPSAYKPRADIGTQKSASDRVSNQHKSVVLLHSHRKKHKGKHI